MGTFSHHLEFRKCLHLHDVICPGNCRNYITLSSELACKTGTDQERKRRRAVSDFRRL